MAAAPPRRQGPRPGGPAPDFSEVDRLTFTCIPGCGFCCTCSPGLVEDEPTVLGRDPVVGPLVVERENGTLGLALGGGKVACTFLQDDRRCGIYEKRPSVCRTFPFHVHLGERIQVNGNLGCPGLWGEATTPDSDPREAAGPMARNALERLLGPGLRKEYEQAQRTYAEFRRRTESLGTHASATRVADAYQPHLATLTTRRGFENWFALLAPCEVDLANLAADLPAQIPEVGALDLMNDIAAETLELDQRKLPAYVDEDRRTWVSVKFADGAFTWYVYDAKRDLVPSGTVDLEDLDPFALTPGARAVVHRYLEGLLDRDHTYGYAAKIVDAMEYQVDVAAAYGRVLADAAGNVLLRAALIAHRKGLSAITETEARQGVMFYDMAFLGMPTIGAVS